MTLKAFYRKNVHYLRSALAFVLTIGGQVAAAGPDVVATWSVRQWAMHVLFACGAALVPLMRAGDFNPQPAGTLVPLEPPKP